MSGLTTLGQAIGVTQNTQAKVSADLASARAADGALQDAINARLDATAANSAEDGGAAAFIRMARDCFKSNLGTAYSQAWKPVGFKNNTLAIPGTAAAWLELVQSIGTYLSTHLSMEVPTIQVTHQFATQTHDNLLGAMSALAQANAAQRTKSAAKTKAVAALRTRLRGPSTNSPSCWQRTTRAGRTSASTSPPTIRRRWRPPISP